MPFPGESMVHAVLSALEEASDLLDELEALDLTDDKVADYIERTREKITGISEWVTEKDFATERQEDAAIQIRDGVQRWLDKVS